MLENTSGNFVGPGIAHGRPPEVDPKAAGRLLSTFATVVGQSLKSSPTYLNYLTLFSSSLFLCCLCPLPHLIPPTHTHTHTRIYILTGLDFRTRRLNRLRPVCERASDLDRSKPGTAGHRVGSELSRAGHRGADRLARLSRPVFPVREDSGVGQSRRQSRRRHRSSICSHYSIYA